MVCYFSDWISVSDFLPAAGVRVLVATKPKKGPRSINLAYWLDGSFHGMGSMAGVTHWMPLPDLPEE